MSDEADSFSLSDYLMGFSDPEARARAWREAGCPQADELGAIASVFWDQTLGPQNALAAGLSNHDFQEYNRKLQLAKLREQHRTEDRVRKQRFMTSEQAKALHAAISFCNFEKNKVLNAKLTLTWSQIGVETPRAAVEAHGRLQNEMGMRLADWGHEHLYVYVHEHTRDLGFHTHVMLHVERGRARKLRRWMKTYFVSNFHPTQVTAYKFEPRHTEKKNKHLPWDATLVRRQWAGYRYMVKSLDPEFYTRDEHGRPAPLHKLLNLKKLVASLPLTNVQRCGVGHALGAAAQQQRWFPRVFHEQRWGDLYTGWELTSGPDMKFRHEMCQALRAMQI